MQLAHIYSWTKKLGWHEVYLIQIRWASFFFFCKVMLALVTHSIFVIRSIFYVIIHYLMNCLHDLKGAIKNVTFRLRIFMILISTEWYVLKIASIQFHWKIYCIRFLASFKNDKHFWYAGGTLEVKSQCRELVCRWWPIFKNYLRPPVKIVISFWISTKLEQLLLHQASIDSIQILSKMTKTELSNELD